MPLGLFIIKSHRSIDYFKKYAISHYLYIFNIYLLLCFSCVGGCICPMTCVEIDNLWKLGIKHSGCQAKPFCWPYYFNVIFSFTFFIVCMCEGQRITCGSQFSSSTMLIVGLELRSAGSAGNSSPQLKGVILSTPEPVCRPTFHILDVVNP